MAHTTTAASPGLRSGNPALSEKFIETQLSASATRSMSVGRRQHQDARPAGRPRRRRRVGMGVGGPAGRRRPRQRLRQHHRHDPRRLLAGQLRRLPARHHRSPSSRGAPRCSVLLYAVCEGFCLGAISAMFDAQTEGIVGAAVLSTLCVFVVALLLYVTRIIKPTQKLAFAVIAGMGGLVLLYSSCSSCRSSTGAGSTATTSAPIGDRRHADRDRARRAQPRARLRHDRGRGAERRAQGARVVPGASG